MIDIINDNFNDLAKDYYKLQEEYEQLEQENKQLKEELETLKDGFDFNLGAIENIRKGKNELEEKIAKAIEYIKKYQEIQAKYCYVDFDNEDIDKLLEILGDKEND